MAAQLKLNVGRERITVAAHPSEAGYIRGIRAQMEAIRKNMEHVIKHIEGVTPEAIAWGLQPIMDKSQELVPVDTGTLKRSGFIETRRTAGGTIAAIGYGRHGIPHYTAFVHENLLVRHAKGKSAKFLEIAIQEKIGDFRRRVERFMAKTMPGLTSGGPSG